MELNSIEELNKLESEIKETQKLLKKNSDDNSKIEKLNKYKKIFALLALFFLITSIWLYFFNPKKTIIKEKKIDPNYTLVRIDSLKNYKHYYFNKNLGNDVNLNDEKIIYYVQLGAFKNFKLNSSKLIGLNQYDDGGLNKITVGTFATYKNAKKLKDELIQLGFKDCFLTAKSYGNKIIDINEALVLSNEEFLIQ